MTICSQSMKHVCMSIFGTSNVLLIIEDD
ncbi:hypothetical protein S091751_2463 [Staphylococcus aureus subsp. aureus 091751]|nr:hypothetical protein Newbould305_0047 [Staphylococcus aureus subsp. aureus str. Newbould 305]EOR32059.1 hypothetical protein S103564_2720 [Staphylococcus aureus subsp. aureus 103564]EOR32187.1 hypothetical protein S091751_2463 [Staphylococcus aureus subsp. aureus 091751]